MDIVKMAGEILKLEGLDDIEINYQKAILSCDEAMTEIIKLKATLVMGYEEYKKLKK